MKSRKRVHNTLRIAERCAIELPFGSHLLPRYQTPAGQSLEEYLEQVTRRGWRRACSANVTLSMPRTCTGNVWRKSWRLSAPPAMPATF